MSDILSPRMSGRYVNKESQHIKCNPKGVAKVAELIYKAITKDGFGRKIWEKNDLNPRGLSEQESINWIFFVDTVNFSFWPDEGDVKFGVKDSKGNLQTGYWSLCAAVSRALKVGIPITDPDFMATATKEQIETVFRSDTAGKIPLLDERVKAINEAGQIVRDKFFGSFSVCVHRAEKDVDKLLELIVDNFESYRDVCQYKEKVVSFLKRAQILVSDIWTCLDAKGLGEFHNIDNITMFADYRVPQSLVAFNVLNYSEELKSILKSKEPIEPNGDIECEIRGMSIYACDQIQEAVREIAREEGVEVEINAILVDYFLWEYARDNRALVDELPFHRCRSIYY